MYSFNFCILRGGYSWSVCVMWDAATHPTMRMCVCVYLCVWVSVCVCVCVYAKNGKVLQDECKKLSRLRPTSKSLKTGPGSVNFLHAKNTFSFLILCVGVGVGWGKP